MAYIPVVLEIDTDSKVETISAGGNPIHSYSAPSGWKIVNAGWSASGDLSFRTFSVYNDGDSFDTDVVNPNAFPVTVTYTFTLIKA
jgi:hypothetical protein